MNIKMSPHTPSQSGSKAKLAKLQTGIKVMDKTVSKLNSNPDLINSGTITVQKELRVADPDNRQSDANTPGTERGRSLDQRSGSVDSEAAKVNAMLKEKMNSTNVDHIVIDQDNDEEEDDDEDVDDIDVSLSNDGKRKNLNLDAVALSNQDQ